MLFEYDFKLEMSPELHLYLHDVIKKALRTKLIILSMLLFATTLLTALTL